MRQTEVGEEEDAGRKSALHGARSCVLGGLWWLAWSLCRTAAEEVGAGVVSVWGQHESSAPRQAWLLPTAQAPGHLVSVAETRAAFALPFEGQWVSHLGQVSSEGKEAQSARRKKCFRNGLRTYNQTESESWGMERPLPCNSKCDFHIADVL